MPASTDHVLRYQIMETQQSVLSRIFSVIIPLLIVACLIVYVGYLAYIWFMSTIYPLILGDIGDSVYYNMLQAEDEANLVILDDDGEESRLSSRSLNNPSQTPLSSMLLSPRQKNIWNGQRNSPNPLNPFKEQLGVKSSMEP